MDKALRPTTQQSKLYDIMQAENPVPRTAWEWSSVSVALACVIGFTTGFLFGRMLTEKTWQEKACETGAGRMVLNPRTGSVEFRWSYDAVNLMRIAETLPQDKQVWLVLTNSVDLSNGGTITLTRGTNSTP